MADKPNLLLTASALVYFIASMPAIFAGEELLDQAGAAGTSLELALLQLLGAATFSLAMLNWMNRYSIIGGILGRPLVVVNFTNSAISALMLFHLSRQAGLSVALGIALGFYALIALAFGAKLFLPARVSMAAILICMTPAVAVDYDPNCLEKTTIQVANRDLVITRQDAERIRLTVEKYLAEKKPKLEPSVTGPGPAFIDCEGTVRMGAWILQSAHSGKQELKMTYRVRTNDLLLVQQVIELKQVAGRWKVAGIDVETFHSLR
jgi:hypothetical protein